MTTTTTPPGSEEEEERHVRPFTEFLLQQARGATHDELSVGLHNLLRSVMETGKGGRVALVIDVKPLGKGDERQVIVTDSVSVKLPTPKRAESFFFVDDAGNLTRSDPRQQELPLQEVGRADLATAKAVNR